VAGLFALVFVSVAHYFGVVPGNPAVSGNLCLQMALNDQYCGAFKTLTVLFLAARRDFWSA
jgi:hypothetical protein